MKPTIGRVVHFYRPGAKRPLAAIITDVRDENWVDLVVFRTSHIEHEGCVEFNAGPLARRWEWPPKEEEKPTHDTMAAGVPWGLGASP